MRIQDQWFDTGAVISSHGGTGAIGLLGIEENNYENKTHSAEWVLLV